LDVRALANFFGTLPVSGHDQALCAGMHPPFSLHLEREMLLPLWRRSLPADT
jgi:hypothetical protein